MSADRAPGAFDSRTSCAARCRDGSTRRLRSPRTSRVRPLASFTLAASSGFQAFQSIRFGRTSNPAASRTTTPIVP